MSERVLKPKLVEHDGKLLVWSEDADPVKGYKGPIASVYRDRIWLRIVTDPYEGHVMLNIETLPALRRALGLIARRVKRADANSPSSDSSHV